MAHHIADLIVRADTATGAEKALAEEGCFRSILELWKHRSELPTGTRPFEDLEPIARAIESLDPDTDLPRYLRRARASSREGKDQPEADKWFSLIDWIDCSARLLIAYCLSEAAQSAVDKSKEWVRLAEAAELEVGVPKAVVQFVSSYSSPGKDQDPNALARQRMQDRIDRLEGFIGLAESVANDMKAQMTALPPLEETNDEAREKEDKSDPSDPAST